MNSRALRELEKKFSPGSWSGELVANVILLEAVSPEVGKSVAKKLESFLKKNGYVMEMTAIRMENFTVHHRTFTIDIPVWDNDTKYTESPTSETWHQNITGIEGWAIDLTKKVFGRFDKQGLRWLKEGGAHTVSFSQMHKLITGMQGAIASLPYSV